MAGSAPDSRISSARPTVRTLKGPAAATRHGSSTTSAHRTAWPWRCRPRGGSQSSSNRASRSTRVGNCSSTTRSTSASRMPTTTSADAAPRHAAARWPEATRSLQRITARYDRTSEGSNKKAPAEAGAASLAVVITTKRLLREEKQAATASGEPKSSLEKPIPSPRQERRANEACRANATRNPRHVSAIDRGAATSATTRTCSPAGVPGHSNRYSRASCLLSLQPGLCPLKSSSLASQSLPAF